MHNFIHDRIDKLTQKVESVEEKFDNICHKHTKRMNNMTDKSLEIETKVHQMKPFIDEHQNGIMQLERRFAGVFDKLQSTIKESKDQAERSRKEVTKKLTDSEATVAIKIDRLQSQVE